MHIYAFGSLCRGDIDINSDIDLLAVVDGHESRVSPDVFSIYSYRRISDIWNEGNPFAWHLARESRLVFTPDESDYLRSLGSPNRYKNCASDCEKFYGLFQQAQRAIETSSDSVVFELSTVFLSIRNIATCFSLGAGVQPDFSRQSAFKLGPNNAPLSDCVYSLLVRARVLSTRGCGTKLTSEEVAFVARELPQINDWMVRVVKEAKKQ